MMFSTCPSVRLSVPELVNTIFWKRMNQICCKLAQVVHGQEGNETVNFWDQEVMWICIARRSEHASNKLPIPVRRRWSPLN